ncbi:MAG: response regulator [Nitrospira sp.]|nr:response regulator [Nitrospira sp.]MCA9476205.1 response regulator [Nitrospira sp.]MCA9480251.1 response regulator [Nitrospira sp.]MCB9711152.1 response regulator [Nitrospiraceae bacterium]MDR4486844.1 response regulator [Nitrospirales bacterium]
MNPPFATPPLPHANILIVEDEEGPRESLKLILSPYYNLFTVDRAEVALEILKNQPIDIVTLDLKLPDGHGTDVLSSLRQMGNDVDVIIITGYGTLQSAIDAIRHGVAAYILKPFNVSELLEIIQKTLERRKRLCSLHDAIQAFGSLWTSDIDSQSAIPHIETLLEAKHGDLLEHAKRVNFYASLLAEHLNLSQTERDIIHLGAYLHDIGKIGIHDRLLSRDSTLSNQDQELLQCHPSIGLQMVANIPFHQSVLDIIRHHHERFDGSGFPDGLQGDAISYPTRIVALANTFDNIITGHGQWKGLPIPEAREAIRLEGGKSLDPQLSDLFAKVVW